MILATKIQTCPQQLLLIDQFPLDATATLRLGAAKLGLNKHNTVVKRNNEIKAMVSKIPRSPSDHFYHSKKSFVILKKFFRMKKNHQNKANQILKSFFFTMRDIFQNFKAIKMIRVWPWEFWYLFSYVCYFYGDTNRVTRCLFKPSEVYHSFGVAAASSRLLSINS